MSLEPRLVVDGDGGAVVVLGPGAGAGLDSDFMTFFAEHLAASDLTVVRFNFRYIEEGRKAPDRQAVLEQTYSSVLDHARARFDERPVVIGGKSMGGRIASHVAVEKEVDGLVFLGYPLHPPGRPDRMRDSHLYEIEAPMLFVEGTRDPFCPLETLETVRRSLRNSTLVVVDDGNHSFKVRKSSGRSTKDAWLQAADHVAAWVKGLRPV
ncbi:MAG: alpha/beta fold hydrolase [Actinomycetota bacterium]|nr:alpha/beta fold hydrolase [Actinomycetota bacterium]